MRDCVHQGHRPAVVSQAVAEERLTELVAAAGKAADDTKDFYAGLGSVLEGMLISPKVLFIIDRRRAGSGEQGSRAPRCLLAGIAPELLPVECGTGR